MIKTLKNFGGKKLGGLILIAVIIIAFGFGGFGGGFSTNNQNNIAKINKTNVTTQDFMNYLNESKISQQVIRENLDNNIIEELLSGLISTTLIDLEIEDFDLSITEFTVLKKIKEKDSLWKGECFVFDNRISLKHGLKVGTYFMCSGCRKPISPKDKKSKKYEEGVSCPNCHDNLTDTQKDRFRMRQKQINLAKKSGSKHIFQKEFK